MITRYEMRTPLLTLIRPFIVMTISAMHRFVMGDMLARLCAQVIGFRHRHDFFASGRSDSVTA
jgi:hypothetical protein